MEPIAPVPGHVNPDLVVDFDIYGPPGVQVDLHDAWRALQQGPAVVRTARNGGHWIATRGDDIVAMQLDHTRYSHRAVSIPRCSSPSLPVESDPPEHGPLRAVISPLFAPEALRRAEARTREITRDLIDRLAPLGRCDFQRDFARQVPISVFMMLVDLPLDDRAMLLDIAEKRVRSADPAERNAANGRALAYIALVVRQRRGRPGQDFVSRILASTVGERPITDFEVENMIVTIFTGGLDTVASVLGFSMRDLAGDDANRRALAADPSVIPRAVDELLRRYGVVNTARLIAKETELHGAAMKAGEQIVLPNALVGVDPRRFERPLDVDCERPDAARHAAFGNGPHRCPGSNLARLELRIVLEEWLARIPDFAVDAAEPTLAASGIVNTLHSLPLCWTPARPSA